MGRWGPRLKAENAVVLISSPFVQCGPGLRDQNSGDVSPPKGERNDPDWESALSSRPGPGPRQIHYFGEDMPRKRVSKSKKVALPVLNPDAAGIDIGATEIYVAVPADRDPEPVRMFATFTQDLNELADWLQQCGIRTVAMESTGVYWIPLMQILESRGLEVYLVNAKHVKNVPGRRTDVSDCQWLAIPAFGRLVARILPSGAGHLRCPFVAAPSGKPRRCGDLPRPAHAESAGSDEPATAPRHQRYHRNDRTGNCGCDSGGNRDVQALAALRDPRIRASHETIAKSLVGDYRQEHLFTLRQSVAMYREYQRQIAACEEEMQRLMKGLETKADPTAATLPPPKDSVKKCKVMPPARAMALREEAYRILGVDLTTFRESASCTYRAYSPNWVAIFRSSAAPEHSVHGWDYAPTTILAAGRFFGAGRERSRIESPSLSAWPLSHFSRVNRLWVCSTAGCVPNSVPQKRSLPPPISSRESFSIC